jgi:DNA-binding CsgD family transcriptional regulator
MKEERQLAAIMFTDIVGYTAIMQRSEAEAMAIRTKHREVFYRYTGQFDGRILQYFGDGTLSVFNSTVGAVECAIKIQQALNQEPVVPLRVGIHEGDIIIREEEAIGDGINVASRIESIAIPGSILISDKVYDDIKNHPSIKTTYLGKVKLKNVHEVVSVYAIANEGIQVPGKNFTKHSEREPESRSKDYRTGYFSSRTRGEDIVPVGRKNEIERIRQFLTPSAKLNTGILFISGVAGIGKSTLLHHCLKDGGYTIIETRAYEDISTAFGPVISILRNLLNGILSDQRDNLNLIDHLGLLLPEYRKEGLDTDDITLVAAVQEIFRKASEISPLLMLIEDIQWADAATLNMIPKITDAGNSGPLLILATYRDDYFSGNQKLRWLKTELRRNQNFQEINLKPLSHAESAEMISQLLKTEVSAELAGIIYDKTQGLPLFIEEIIKTLKAGNLLVNTEKGISIKSSVDIPMPDTISDTVALQLDDISLKAREMLELAATMGIEFDFDLLYEIAPDDQAIDELLQKQLIFEFRRGTGTFKHNLILNAIRKDISWSKRKSLNRRVAGVLEKRNVSPEIVGEYWLRAGEKIKARTAYIDAAQQYCNIHAHWDAAMLADKALELWPKGDDELNRLAALKQFANCMKISGQINESVMALKELLESPLLKENPVEQASIFRNLASSYALKAQWQQYKQSRESAARLHEKSEKWDEACVDWRELANHLTDILNVREALIAAEASIRCANNSGKKDLQIRAYSTKSYLLSMQGRSEDALKLASEALDLARTGEYIEASAFAYRKLAGVHEYASNFNESIRVYDSALAFCRREDLSLQTLFCLSCMSWVLFRLGEWTRSLEVCREVIEDKETNDASKATGYLVMALIKIYRGENRTAHKYLEESNLLATRLNFRMIILIIHWAQAAILEFEGRPDEACESYLSMLDFWRSSDDKHDILGGLSAAVSFFGDHGYREDVMRCVSVNSTIAEETGNPEAIGVMAFSLGISAHLMERFEEAVTHLEKALSYFNELEVPLQIIYTQYHLGKALIALDKKSKAIPCLKQAILKARNLGIRTMASRIGSILADLDEVPADRRSEEHETRKSVAGLTSRQYEILQALSEGLSNKEIASRLFISTRTVDMHVSNILDTLNCRSRVEAVKSAMEMGII